MRKSPISFIEKLEVVEALKEATHQIGETVYFKTGFNDSVIANGIEGATAPMVAKIRRQLYPNFVRMSGGGRPTQQVTSEDQVYQKLDDLDQKLNTLLGATADLTQRVAYLERTPTEEITRPSPVSQSRLSKAERWDKQQ
jgi:hypothetical protein